jgi:hypothetical protein
MHYEETDGIGVLDSVKNLGGVGRGSVDGTGACLRCSNTTGRANRASRKEET